MIAISITIMIKMIMRTKIKIENTNNIFSNNANGVKNSHGYRNSKNNNDSNELWRWYSKNQYDGNNTDINDNLDDNGGNAEHKDYKKKIIIMFINTNGNIELE